MMSNLEISDPIVDWVIEYPFSVPLFERLGIDYTCGGKSLHYACEQRELDARQIAQEILGTASEAEVDFRAGLQSPDSTRANDDPSQAPGCQGG